MTFIPAVNVGTFVLNYLWSGQKCANVFHNQFTSQPDVVTMAVVAEAYKSWWLTSLRLSLSSALSLQSISFYDATVEGGEGAEITDDLPATGATGGAAVANNVAFCITLRTAARGRSARGRSYIPGLPASNVVDSRLDTGHVADLVSSYNTLIDSMQDVAAPIVIVSKYHNKLPRTTALIQPVQAAVAVDNVVDSQRRRLPGRGT